MLRFNSTVETLRLGGPLEEPADPVGRGDTLRSGLTEEDGNSANSTRVLFSPSSTSAVSSEGASEGGEQKLSEARNVASTKEEDAAAVRRELFLRLLSHLSLARIWGWLDEALVGVAEVVVRLGGAGRYLNTAATFRILSWTVHWRGMGGGRPQ